MKKRNKIIYWIATVWLVLGMSSTAIVQMMHAKEEVAKTSVKLGYPMYFLTLIGIAKIAGVLAVLAPRLALVKEWAYAGFAFLMCGAIISHIAVADDAKELFGPALLLVLTVVSWSFRPAERRVASL